MEAYSHDSEGASMITASSISFTFGYDEFFNLLIQIKLCPFTVMGDNYESRPTENFLGSEREYADPTVKNLGGNFNQMFKMVD